MEDNILAEKRMQEEARAEEELFSTLIAQSTFGDIPAMLVQSEVEKMVQELLAHVQEQGMEKEIIHYWNLHFIRRCSRRSQGRI